MRMHKRIKSIDQYSRGKMKKKLPPIILDKRDAP